MLGIELLTSLSEAGDASAALRARDRPTGRADPPSPTPERARQIFQAHGRCGGCPGERGNSVEMYRDGDGGPVVCRACDMNSFPGRSRTGRPEAARKQSDLLASLGRFAEARSVAVARVAAGEPVFFMRRSSLPLPISAEPSGRRPQPEEAQSVLRQDLLADRRPADPALRMLELTLRSAACPSKSTYPRP